LVEPDEDKLKKLAVTLPLSERDLRQAGFSGSDLRQADLRSADLSGANLNGAKVERRQPALRRPEQCQPHDTAYANR
jgi:uncharacterized protein YjbI with pentapeptide repeats